MSGADDSSGHIHGSLDQSENAVDQDTSTEATCTLSKLATIQHQPQDVAPGKSDPSRKHGALRESPEGSLKAHPEPRPFQKDSQPGHVPFELDSDIPAEEEKGRSQEIHQQQTMEVNSSSNCRMKPLLSRRHSMSGSSSPLHQLEKELRKTTNEKRELEELYKRWEQGMDMHVRMSVGLFMLCTFSTCTFVLNL